MACRVSSRVAVAALVVLPWLAACETTGGGNSFASLAPGAGPQRTPAEWALLDSSDEIVMRSTVQGVVAGAVLGCVSGLLIGGGVEDCLIGTAAGGVGGGVAGNVVGRGNAAAAQREFEEDQLIAALSEQEQDLLRLEQNLKVALAEQRRRLDDLNRQLAAGEIDEAAYRREEADMRAVRTQVAEALAQEKANREALDVELLAWREAGEDVDAVADANEQNLDRIDRLIDVANSFDPASV